MPEPNVSMGDLHVTGDIYQNGVLLGAGEAMGVLAGMAIARMRGAGPTDSGVITVTGDATSDDLKVVAQTSPNMSVKVKAGACIVLGVFTGIAADISIAIAAPLTNNRITIIQINKSGTVTKKDGTEAGSPTAPTPDANNKKLGQVLCTVAMTEIEDADCTDNRTFI